MIKIAPSILAADFSMLGEEIIRVEKAGADIIHVDVMDGHFVPNISIGPPVIKAIRKITKLPFDVHLMIEEPDMYIDSFIDAGADIVSVHVEVCNHLNRTLKRIKDRGRKAAVAVNPTTPLDSLKWVLSDIDMVLLMTVNPGFGGQSYIEFMTDKIGELKEIVRREKTVIDIEIDGGIDLSNIYEVTHAGANVIVAGSSIYHSKDIEGTIRQLKNRAFKD
jgi:ribulose-phosphate 3-epimerase